MATELFGIDLSYANKITDYKKLLNTVHAPQPTPHWMYNGRNLQDIYDETYPFTEE